MVTQLLDQLNDRFPGCDTLAFADLATQMILITNSASSYQRAALEALCAEATLLFGPPGTATLGAAPANTIFVATPDHLRIYLRDPAAPTEALCCLCHHTAQLDDFVTAARDCLGQISHAG